jgi:acetylornithine aminotransferase
MTAFAPGVVSRLGSRPVKYAQSHQNDPLGAAVALEVARVIREEGLIERGREIGATLVSGLEGIKTRTGQIKEIRARGLMVAAELEDDAEASVTARTQRELVDRGFIVAQRPDTNVLRIDPSLTIDRRDIERFLETLENVLIDIGSAGS